MKFKIKEEKVLLIRIN